MLQEVLNHHIPDTWEKREISYYRSNRFILLDLNSMDDEYLEATSNFAGCRLAVSSVSRVQNPFILGRFILRKENLGSNTQVKRVYHPIDARDIKVVCDYNCDYRRYVNKNGMQYQNKRPVFYTTPAAAAEMFERYPMSEKAMVVVKVLDPPSYSTSFTKDWDTEYCPEFIVRLE